MQKDKNYYAKITKKASRTFYLLTLFFPKKARRDVFILYTFLRRADDMIDSKVVNYNSFLNYKKETFKAYENLESSDFALNEFSFLCRRVGIKKELIESFFNSLEIDFERKSYSSYEDLLSFVYGVAEVVGLMMAKILGLHEDSYESAKLLGRGMQLTNIIRDIVEDFELGRLYIPLDDLKSFSVKRNFLTNNSNCDSNFKELIKFQCDRAVKEIKKAEKGFKFISNRYLYVIKTSSDVYLWVLGKIHKNPEVIFEKKVKPPIYLILFFLLKNFFKLNFKLNFSEKRKHQETRT